MDKQKFDNLTRLFGSGLSRRQVIRGLVGGAGALAVTGATRQFAGAQICAARVDCENVQQENCTNICPQGSQAGNNRGTSGTCCTGNGTCCSNNCVAGVCDGPPPPECTSPADCDVCEVCDSGTCIPTGEEYCEAGGYCYSPSTGACCTSDECGCGECVQGQCVALECCADSDCAQPDSCTLASCVNNVCSTASSCPAGELCCPAQGGSCAPCCDDGDCPAGTPICYNPGDPTNAYCVACVDDGDCGACKECEGHMCVALNDCCTSDDDCDPCESCDSGTCVSDCEPGETCVNGECETEHCDPNADTITCPPGSFHAGLTKKPDGGCCNGNGNCCSNNCVNGFCVGNCPQGELYCERTQSCYNPAYECCYDDNCEGCAVCNNANMCSDPECCNDSDCPDCYSCAVEEGVCVESLCFIGEECCNDQCVPIGDCCKGVGEYCGVLEVTTSWFGSPQVDCCDGLVCCEHKSHGATCAECCNDWDCPKGAYCHEGWCEWPDKECHHDKDCPYGTCCCNDGSCSGKCCNHHPHHPHHPKPTPPKPAPPASGGTVSNLPGTGAGPSDEKNSFLGVAALGAAAALFAKKLRETPGEGTSQK